MPTRRPTIGQMKEPSFRSVFFLTSKTLTREIALVRVTKKPTRKEIAFLTKSVFATRRSPAAKAKTTRKRLKVVRVFEGVLRKRTSPITE